MAVRQEVLNVLLAQLLQERGIIAAPEQIQSSHQMPDVLVDLQGLRLAIEGEFASRGAMASAERKASEAALKRVDQGIAHIGMAVLYPSSLRSIAFKELKRELAKARLRFAIVTELQAVEMQQLSFFAMEEEEPISFTEGDLNALADSLRRAYEQLVQDEVLERAVEKLQKSIERFVGALTAQPATPERFATTLGIQELSKSKTKKADEPEET